MLVPTNESKKEKKIFKKYEELWSKIRDLIRSITKHADGNDEKYMKIKFNSDDELPLNKKDRNSWHDNSYQSSL